MKKNEIQGYLASLEKRILSKKNEKPVELTNDWAKTFPIHAGVYLIKENGVICYVGETGSIRARMRDLLRTTNHVIRRSIGHLNFNTHTNYHKATPKIKFHIEIETLLEHWMRESLTISVLPVELGRKELEEFIYNNHSPKYNNKGKRLSKMTREEILFDSIKDWKKIL
jgi:hypothetical protein